MTAPFNVPDLINGGWNSLDFVPFREGIEIAKILEGEPALAILRYQPGATVPAHRHPAPETVLVLEGSQTDDNGHYPTGTLIVNTTGSSHNVWSTDGCVVLVQWAKPIEFSGTK